jgi:S-adenosylmethionine hydrolase
MIALLSDFGLDDIYVGVMKSVIESITPGMAVIDITHSVPSHDIRSASFLLRGALPYFPAGTVVVAVVDPGVGTERLPVAVRSGKVLILSPNNGLVSGIKIDEAYYVNKLTELRQGLISTTFHGRDIFAPAAAFLVKSSDPNTIGTPIETRSIVTIDRTTVHRTDSALTAEIQHIDRFGNIITNITPDLLAVWAMDTDNFTVAIGNTALYAKRCATYADGRGFEGVLLIPNSFGLIEIAATNFSASDQYGKVTAGQSVTVRRGE